MKAWQTKHAGLHKQQYVPQGNAKTKRRPQAGSAPAGLGSVFTFATGRFRKTSRGWRRVPG